MKKPLLITVIIIVLVLALPIINFIRWSLQEKKPIDIVILDKTVPTLQRTHHKSLTWILNSERFVKKENKSSYMDLGMLYRDQFFLQIPNFVIQSVSYQYLRYDKFLYHRRCQLRIDVECKQLMM